MYEGQDRRTQDRLLRYVISDTGLGSSRLPNDSSVGIHGGYLKVAEWVSSNLPDHPEVSPAEVRRLFRALPRAVEALMQVFAIQDSTLGRLGLDYTPYVVPFGCQPRQYFKLERLLGGPRPEEQGLKIEERLALRPLWEFDYLKLTWNYFSKQSEFEKHVREDKYSNPLLAALATTAKEARLFGRFGGSYFEDQAFMRTFFEWFSPMNKEGNAQMVMCHYLGAFHRELGLSDKEVTQLLSEPNAAVIMRRASERLGGAQLPEPEEALKRVKEELAIKKMFELDYYTRIAFWGSGGQELVKFGVGDLYLRAQKSGVLSSPRVARYIALQFLLQAGLDDPMTPGGDSLVTDGLERLSADTTAPLHAGQIISLGVIPRAFAPHFRSVLNETVLASGEGAALFGTRQSINVTRCSDYIRAAIETNRDWLARELTQQQ